MCRRTLASRLLLPLTAAAGLMLGAAGALAQAPDFVESIVPAAFDAGGCATIPGCAPQATAACCLCDQETLLGDCCGLRSGLAESGITVYSDLTHFYQGVTEGGRERLWEYGAHSDTIITADLSKFGLWQGLSLKVRGEGKLGETVNGATGALMPVALLPGLPVFDENDAYAVTNFVFTQVLSEEFAMFFGKIDALDGDQNAFASGRGKTQFLNAGFIANPVALRVIPYSTLAAGFSILQEGEPILTFSVMNPRDTTTTIGLDELFADGIAIGTELRLPTELFGLPGHHLFGGAWNSAEFIATQQDPRILFPGSTVPVNRVPGTWALYYNFDQYLVVDPSNPQRGWGVFGRAGIADDNPNPIPYFLSIGLGGSSMLAARDRDSWGAGFYYLGATDELPQILGLSDERGFEVYYRASITPWLDVTPDLQVIDGGLRQPTATVAGVRVNMIF